MANYKYENGNYYRQSTNGNWFKVLRDNDGYLIWTLPDGRKVKDDQFRVPISMLVQNSKIGPMYTIGTGANGSLGHYFSFLDAANAYTKAKESGAFSDPSENILNDLIFDTATGKGAISLTTRGVKAASQMVPLMVRATWNAGKRLVTKGITKEAAKEGVKKGLKTSVKLVAREAPKMAVAGAAGYGVNKGSEALTGKSWGENVALGLTEHYGFRVSPFVGELTNPGYYVGYGVANKGMKELEKAFKEMRAARKARLMPEEVEPILVESPEEIIVSEPIDMTRAISESGSRTPLDASFEEAIYSISQEDFRASLERLRSERMSTPAPTRVVPENVPYKESANYLTGLGYVETFPGVYERESRIIDLNSPRVYGIQDGLLLELDIYSLLDLKTYLSRNFRRVSKETAEDIQTHPYVLEYRKGEPFTLETLPGKDRTDLVEDLDVTHMEHFTGNPILNNEGHIVGHLSDTSQPYNKVMLQEFNDTPHGASIGFNQYGATSTSSTPMFWLLMLKGLRNKSLARVYVPLNGSRYVLNNLGRAYLLDRKGRMVAVPGTERRAFKIPYEPEYKGAKNMKYTLPDGTEIEVILFPDGSYFNTESIKPVSDISQASKAYYHNGAIYDGYNHRVLYSVDLPFLTREQFVDQLNSHYIKPLAYEAGITIKPASIRGRLIEVPSIAGIKFKQGGSIINLFRRNRRCKKN